MVLGHDFSPRYPYNDYIKWEGRWELINGLAYAMTPAPSIRHQELCGKIYEEQGVKYYILVDIKGNFAEVYELIDGRYRLTGEFKNEIFRFDIDTYILDFDFDRIFS